MSDKRLDGFAADAPDDTPAGCYQFCPACGTCWPERETFIADPAVALTGYVTDFKHLELGLFLFNHGTCRSTMAIEARRFADLYDGVVFTQRKTGTDDCPGYCLQKTNLDPCPAQCECAWVRELMQLWAAA